MQLMIERPQSLGEEITNSVSHGVALLAVIVAVPFLIAAASHFRVANVVGTGVFAATMVLLYLTSTLYHALPAGRAKRVFMKLDHGANVRKFQNLEEAFLREATVGWAQPTRNAHAVGLLKTGAYVPGTPVCGSAQTHRSTPCVT